MIVKCDQCQTRFKIPDEKVTEKGVKVRCTKCQNTFRVKKGAAETAATTPPSPAAAAPEADPFAQFSAPFDDETKVSPSPLTPSYTAQKHLGSEVFEQPTRVAPIPGTSKAKAGPGLGFSTLR